VVGALLWIYISRGDDEAARRNARWIALWTTLITSRVSLILAGASIRLSPTSSSSKRAPWLANGHHLPHWVWTAFRCRFVILTTGVDAFLHLRQLEKSITIRGGIHDGVSCSWNADGSAPSRRYDLVVFYCFFPGAADPDVPDHRGVWAARAGFYACPSSSFLYTLLGMSVWDAARAIMCVVLTRHLRIFRL